MNEDFSLIRKPKIPKDEDCTDIAEALLKEAGVNVVRVKGPSFPIYTQNDELIHLDVEGKAADSIEEAVEIIKEREGILILFLYKVTKTFYNSRDSRFIFRINFLEQRKGD